MLDVRHAGSFVHAVVVVSATALGVAVGVAACATGGGEGGPSAFTSTDPPVVLPVAGADAASTSAAQPSTAMPDGCPDVSETSVVATGNDDALDGASQDEPQATDEFPLGADAAEPDADDDGPSSTVATLPLPVPGDLVITEIMSQPSGPEPESEWFEIYNQSSYPVLLSGVTIEDGYLDTQVIASNPVLVAQPGEYLLLVRSRSGAAAALLPSAAIVYAYGAGIPDDEGIELDAGPFGELALLNGQTVLADVPYGQWGVSTPGQSLELGTSATTQSDPSGWCIAQSSWGPGSDDGTPGAASDCQ